MDKHSVISFDLFDTLLGRPFAAPRDAFKRFGVDFWAARQAAEKQVVPIMNNFFDNLSAEDKAEFAKIKHSPSGDHRYWSIFA